MNALSKHPYLLGGVIGIGSLPVHAILPLLQSIELAAILMGVIAGAYIGFAARAGDLRIFALELVVALAFAFAALAGLWWSMWVIPAVYVLHAGWDLLHRHEALQDILPDWYVPFCLSVDVIAGLGLILIWSA